MGCCVSSPKPAETEPPKKEHKSSKAIKKPEWRSEGMTRAELEVRKRNACDRNAA